VECVPVEGRLGPRSVPEVGAHSPRHNGCRLVGSVGRMLLMVTRHCHDAAGFGSLAERPGFRMRSGLAGCLRVRVHHRARTPGLPSLLIRARQPSRAADRLVARVGSVVHGRTTRDPRAKSDCRGSTYSSPSRQGPTDLRKLPVAGRQAVPLWAESGSLRRADGRARECPYCVRPQRFNAPPRTGEDCHSEWTSHAG
jgi:hypothetical protein